MKYELENVSFNFISVRCIPTRTVTYVDIILPQNWNCTNLCTTTNPSLHQNVFKIFKYSILITQFSICQHRCVHIIKTVLAFRYIIQSHLQLYFVVWINYHIKIAFYVVPTVNSLRVGFLIRTMYTPNLPLSYYICMFVFCVFSILK